MLNTITLIIALSDGLLGWNYLSDVKTELRYVEQFRQKVEIPIFGEELRSKEGKEFIVSGHFIPAAVEGNTVILSKMPFAACFFCGGAGIDSVIEVQFEGKPRTFDLDEIVKVSGTLVLNDSDFDHMIFILKDAKEIK